MSQLAVLLSLLTAACTSPPSGTVTRDVPPPPLLPGLPTVNPAASGNCPSPTAEEIEAAQESQAYCMIVGALDAAVHVRVTGVRAEREKMQWANWPDHAASDPSSEQCISVGRAFPTLVLAAEVLDVLTAPGGDVPPVLEAALPAFPRYDEHWNPEPVFGADGELIWEAHSWGEPGGYLAPGLELVMFLYRVPGTEGWTTQYHELLQVIDGALTRQEHQSRVDDWCPPEALLSFSHVLDAQTLDDLKAKLSVCASVTDPDLLDRMAAWAAANDEDLNGGLERAWIDASYCLLSREVWAAESASETAQ